MHMKTKVKFFLGVMFLFIGGMVAQTERPVKQSEKLVVGGKVSTLTLKPAQSGVQIQDNASDMNNPATGQSEKQKNAENRSNAHAFSGKGNGKKLNLKDPQPAIKQAKKDPKGLKKE